MNAGPKFHSTLSKMSIVRVEVKCTPVDIARPYKTWDAELFEGTAFLVTPSIFKRAPFYHANKIFYMTNFHVIDDADNRTCYLTMAGVGHSFMTGHVEIAIPGLDTAVISVDLMGDHERWFLDTPISDFIGTPLALCRERIKPDSQKVYTIGYPEGENAIETHGRVSGQAGDNSGMLCLNMSLNSGNSGGALFLDGSSNVIGICTATLEDGEAMSYAVPVHSVLRYLEYWADFNTSYMLMPSWGFKLQTLTDADATQYGVPWKGAIIKDVHGPVKQLLKNNDILYRINDTELDIFGEVKDPYILPMVSIHNLNFILSHTPGDISLHIRRKGKPMVVQFTPTNPGYKIGAGHKEWDLQDYAALGSMVFQNTNNKTLVVEEESDLKGTIRIAVRAAKHSKLREVVILTYVEKHGYVSNFKILKRYDIITKVDGTRIKSIEHLRSLIRDLGMKYRAGQTTVCIETTERTLWLSLKELEKEERASDIPSDHLCLCSKKRRRAAERTGGVLKKPSLQARAMEMMPAR